MKMTDDTTVLVIDDDVTLNRMLCAQLKAGGYTTIGAHCWSEAESLLGEREPSLALLDIKLPDANGLEKMEQLKEVCPVIVLTAYGTIDQAVMAIKRGAADYLAKPVNPDALDLTVKRTLSMLQLQRNYEFYKRQALSGAEQTLVGKSTPMMELRKMIRIVGPSDTTVLITGESGVGKELVAAAVHKASARADANFVAIDCSTLQPNLFESELFGHERGAFTGADRRKEGLIEVASGGTVFLDEIGEMSTALQAKLLRVLETGRYRRLGGTKDLNAHVRFIAATNRDLEAMCRDGTFRSDLFYRLSAFSIKVPALRERKEDIALLAEHFLRTRTFDRNTKKRWSPAAIDALSDYGWPGNVRELRNVVERAALVSGGESEIRLVHCGQLGRHAGAVGRFTFSFDRAPKMEEIAEIYLQKLLKEQRLTRREIAETLGVSERNVYRMLEKLNAGGARPE